MKTNTGKRKGTGRRTLGVASAALATLALASTSAHAQFGGPNTIIGTVGSGDGAVSAAALIGIFTNFGAGLINPSSDPPALIDLSGVPTAFIANPYIGVTLGIAGNYTVDWPGNGVPDPQHNVAGMISFGNVKGSLTYANDDLHALVGNTYPAPIYELWTGGKPEGYGVWPIPGHWQTNTGAYDYSAYMRMQVDNTVVPIVGDGATITEGPIFTNNVLSITWLEDNNIQVRLEIRVFRATAQLRWIVTNQDAAGHTINMRWTVPVRAADGITGAGGQGFGYFFEVPGLGISRDRQVLTANQIPDTFNVYGKRFDTDDVNDPPYGAHFRFRGFGATPPNGLYLADSFELRPEDGTFLPDADRPNLLNGLAVAAYYGPFVLAPGQSQEIITYFGNGNVTERPDADVVVAADAPAALAYNANAATDPELVGNQTADPIAGSLKFLTPNNFQIWGGIYNRSVADPQQALNLTNVRASLTLPPGLALGTRTDGSAETAEKVIGTITADRPTDVNWFVRPTATNFGTLTYQVNASSNERGSRQVSRTITIPVTPFRTLTSSRFQMIGFPFEFDPLLSNNGDPSTVLNGLTDPDDGNTTLYEWVPNLQKPNGGDYVFPVTRLVNGKGYFYRPDLNRTIYAKGVKPWPGQAPLGSTDFGNTNQRQITLEPGWNMISNPYVYDIPLGYLRFVPDVNNPAAASQSFAAAINSGLVRPGVFFYDPSAANNINGYDFLDNLNETLKPWEAYWIYVSSRTALVFSIPTQKQSGIVPGPNSADPEPATRSRRGAIASGRAFGRNQTTSDWRLQLVATRGEGVGDRALVLGTSNSTMSEGQRLLPKPPTPVSDYVYLGIVKDDKGTRYAKDIRSGRGTQTWNVEVTSDKDGPVTLSWPNIGALPRTVALSVKEESTNRVTAMRNASSITVNVKQGVPTRLVFTATAGASQPLVISGVRSTSSAETRATGSRSFEFNLTRAATVTITIKTLSGKTVSTVAPGRAATAGVNRITWNGRSQDGSPLPPGAYNVEITAQDTEGVKTTVRQQFMTLQ